MSLGWGPTGAGLGSRLSAGDLGRIVVRYGASQTELPLGRVRSVSGLEGQWAARPESPDSLG